MKARDSSTKPLIAVLVFVFGTLNISMGVGQDIPKGVNYKKASPEINAKAKTALEQALSATEVPTNFLTEVISCGPILWNDLKSSQELLSKDSTRVTMFLSVPDPLQAEGRGFRTQEQRDRFWKLVLGKFPELSKGTVRPAQANEIQFYWATIPFDIEEPFFAIETQGNVFVANLRFNNGKPVLFWLDRVDDLRTLKKH